MFVHCAYEVLVYAYEHDKQESFADAYQKANDYVLHKCFLA